MAQTNAISIFKADGSTPETLTESYAQLIDQVQKTAISVALKNQEISGDPQSGSVVARRLETSLVKTYGTARTAGEGDKINNNGVTVNLDQRKEIVKEVNTFDVVQFGIPALINRQRTSFSLSMAAHLDRAFFTEAEAEGTSVDLSGYSTIEDKIEALIQSVETVTNDNVDGVDRALIALTVTPEVYGELENYVDTLPNPNGVDVPTFHGVRIYSNHRQTEDAIAMMVGAVAQPVAVVDFKTGEIPLSNETAMQMFFNYGTQAVMPDLIMYGTVIAEVSA
jgi:hypothetical protein